MISRQKIISKKAAMTTMTKKLTMRKQQKIISQILILQI
jgi:hypothetical protein